MDRISWINSIKDDHFVCRVCEVLTYCVPRSHLSVRPPIHLPIPPFLPPACAEHLPCTDLVLGLELQG